MDTAAITRIASASFKTPSVSLSMTPPATLADITLCTAPQMMTALEQRPWLWDDDVFKRVGTLMTEARDATPHNIWKTIDPVLIDLLRNYGSFEALRKIVDRPDSVFTPEMRAFKMVPAFRYDEGDHDHGAHLLSSAMVLFKSPQDRWEFIEVSLAYWGNDSNWWRLAPQLFGFAGTLYDSPEKQWGFFVLILRRRKAENSLRLAGLAFNMLRGEELCEGLRHMAPGRDETQAIPPVELVERCEEWISRLLIDKNRNFSSGLFCKQLREMGMEEQQIRQMLEAYYKGRSRIADYSATTDGVMARLIREMRAMGFNHDVQLDLVSEGIPRSDHWDTEGSIKALLEVVQRIIRVLSVEAAAKFLHLTLKLTLPAGFRSMLHIFSQIEDEDLQRTLDYFKKLDAELVRRNRYYEDRALSNAIIQLIDKFPFEREKFLRMLESLEIMPVDLVEPVLKAKLVKGAAFDW